jgi:hypothetical protein
MSADFTFPDITVKAIEALRDTFGVKSNAEIISGALALAQIVAEQADDQHTIVIAGKDNEPIKMTLAA